VFFAAEILIIINTIKIKQMKKLYEKPSMRVFDLKQQPQLLAGSGLNDPTDYSDGGDPFAEP